VTAFTILRQALAPMCYRSHPWLLSQEQSERRKGAQGGKPEKGGFVKGAGAMRIAQAPDAREGLLGQAGGTKEGGGSAGSKHSVRCPRLLKPAAHPILTPHRESPRARSLLSRALRHAAAAGCQLATSVLRRSLFASFFARR